MNTPAERIILGIDPGTTIMGFGLIRVIGKSMEFIQLQELHVFPHNLDQAETHDGGSRINSQNNSLVCHCYEKPLLKMLPALKH